MRDGAKTNEPERLETYLELARYLEQLQREHRPRRPRQMTPGQVSIYQMAALFHAAAPEAAEPEPCFALALWIQINGLLRHRRWMLHRYEVSSIDFLEGNSNLGDAQRLDRGEDGGE